MLKENYASVGLTLQKLICDKYNIIPDSEQAINQFKAAYDESIKNDIDALISELFNALQLSPVECKTFSFDDAGNLIPFNFILSDNSTLSIRTNIKGSKVAPRIVGQAGFEKLNYYFSKIYGKKLENQDDIKHLITEKTDLVLPVFFDFLFDADYIVWVFNEKDKFSYHLIKGDSVADLDFKKENFSFTRDFNNWIESTTLKYKGKSIAEIQVHKNRSFKFRFIMSNIMPLIISKNMTNETIGITAEKVICDIFKLDYPNNFFKRYSADTQYQISNAIRDAFRYIPNPIKYCGSTSGLRGGASKCSYDFLLLGNKTLSLKTNIGKMVCPPEVGQPNDKTAYLYFKELIRETYIDKAVFKEMVLNNVDKMIPIYIEHMFDSDYLLWLFESKESFLRTGSPFSYEILTKNYGVDHKWDKDKFSFSKKSLSEWNESNTLYYDGISIGEFQVHNNRNCFKFRFNFKNLIYLLNGGKTYEG